MSHSATTVHHIPAATITHTTVMLRGQLESDVAVYHARTPHVRISLALGTTAMGLYTCQAAQGLLEAFAAARAAAAQLPREIPAKAPYQPFARTTLCVDWTHRPVYCVVPQSGPNKTGNGVIHWLDLHCGPLTFQIRDQAALRSAIDLFTNVHKTAVVVCLDGPEHAADPTGLDYRYPE